MKTVAQSVGSTISDSLWSQMLDLRTNQDVDVVPLSTHLHHLALSANSQPLEAQSDEKAASMLIALGSRLPTRASQVRPNRGAMQKLT